LRRALEPEETRDRIIAWSRGTSELDALEGAFETYAVREVIVSWGRARPA